jgi:hypothetical protein
MQVSNTKRISGDHFEGKPMSSPPEATIRSAPARIGHQLHHRDVNASQPRRNSKPKRNRYAL